MVVERILWERDVTSDGTYVEKVRQLAMSDCSKGTKDWHGMAVEYFI